MKDVSEFFVHNTTGNKRMTVRLDLNSLVLLPTVGGFLAQMYGSFSRVHPKDKYNHKVGRELTRNKPFTLLKFDIGLMVYCPVSNGYTSRLYNEELCLYLDVIIGGNKKVFIENVK